MSLAASPAAATAPRAAERAPGAWACFRADLGRYFRYARAETFWDRVRIAVHTEAVAALAVYRLGQWLRDEAPPPVRAALKIPHSICFHVVRLAVGICIESEARIGPGLYIGHSGGIWVAPGAVIGSGCNLSQGVTIGIAGTARRGAPIIGDRVWIGPHATVSGPVKVASGAVVGANSLVLRNVPEKGVAIGVPARVVALSGSDGLIG